MITNSKMFHFRSRSLEGRITVTTSTCCLLLGTLLLCSLSSRGTQALTLNELYPYGSQDEVLNREATDVSSPEIALTVPIVLFQDTFGSVYVNDNGLLSFMTEISAYYNREFPLFYPIIAPMYSDVDTSKNGQGTIYYRETKEASLLDRASMDVFRHFSGGKNFRATGLFIVTWSDVPPIDEKQHHLRNTVQVVVASNGTESYCFFLYPEAGIQWTQGKKDISNVYAYTQAGFMTGDGRFYQLPGSGTDQLKNFPIMSNVNRKGLFAFHIGNTGSGNIILPDRDYERSLKNIGSLETCTSTDFPCLPSANCIGFSTGICCECQRGYFGNGRSCLVQDEALRVNGKLNGVVNSQRLEDVTVYVYVETKDGRVYSGINGVNPVLGFDLQTALVPLSSVISWLFAAPINGAPNGFTLTGGRFNRTLSVVYPQTGHQATLSEQYLGLDVFNFLNVKSELTGSLPTIPTGDSVQVEEYTVEFTQVGPGTVKSRLSTAFTFGENSVSMPMIIDQTITFEGCPHRPMNNTAAITRLSVGGNHLTYETANQIARYASDAKISFLSDNPCTDVRCGPNSVCIVEGTKHRCECSRGFEQVYDEAAAGSEPVCGDIDECRRNVCHPNAECFNEPGSYRCRCAPGYTGDGVYCQSVSAVENTCNNIRCHENGECIQTRNMGPRCMCRNGYYGDGYQCQAMPDVEAAPADDCRNLTLCDLNAECRPNRLQGKYDCFCKAGFRGDGIVCTAEAESCEKLTNCGTNAECISDESSNHAYYCACNPGYVGDGYTCIAQINSDDCSYLNNCHRSAQCLQDGASNSYVCRCNPGFIGDGYRCREEPSVARVPDYARENLGCNGPEGCSPHADCVTMPADSAVLRNECRCRAGYIGDGVLCTAISECDPNSENQCQRNAVCLYSDISRRHECQCSVGYTADRNGRCQVATSASSSSTSNVLDLSCSVSGDCHSNATCRTDPDSLALHCQCNVGFEGDGKRQCRRLQSCQLHNTCDVKASCVLDRRTDSYRCECNAGFAGDGHRCRPIRSCGEDRTICDRHADCQYSYLQREYACSCQLGFIGDGYTCTPVPARSRGDGGAEEGEYLLLAQGATILRMALPESTRRPVGGRPAAAAPAESSLTSLTSAGYPLITKSRQIIVGLDVDCLQGSLYWGDVATGVIYQSLGNGSQAEAVSSMVTSSDTIQPAPEGVAVDWVSRNLYWTDSRRRTVEVSNLDGNNAKVVVKEGLVSPRGIALHPGSGKLFWSDWSRDAPKIESANLDGSGRVVLLNKDLKLPNNLVVDYEHNDLCWTDAGTHRIECLNLYTSSRRVVTLTAAYPFDLAIVGSNIFWTDWDTKAVHQIDRNGGVAVKLDVPRGGHGRLYGLVAVPRQCPRLTNACAVSNGGCKHLCLPNGPHGGRTCACPDHGYDENDYCNDM